MRKYLLSFLLLLSSFCFAQKEASIWYFGENAGLDFNTGNPVPLNDGALVTQEGCATIADFNGNLLFYTDGSTIWNRNHSIMANGTNLNGDASSTQSAIIVPLPGDPTSYYIFTVHDLGLPEGLQYSIVDMTLNGGLGDVTTKNIVLATPVLEKLTAVSHANGTDIWILAHRYGGDEFLAYLMTPTGLVTTPVLSAAGINYPFLANGVGASGYMKVSPDGTTVALASANSVEILQFNSATGVFSNPIPLASYYQNPPFNSRYLFYGVEFSSDGSKVYISKTTFTAPFQFRFSIDQFDVSTYNQTAILNSGVEITGMQDVIDISALQLAIDGKIYVSRGYESYLGVINNPNAPGVTSNYVPNALALAPGTTARLGLPPFIQSFFVVGLQANNLCLGDTTEFLASSSEPITAIIWDFGDGNTSVIEEPTHVYAAPGDYTVRVTVTTSSETKTKTKNITIYETPTANMVTNVAVCDDILTYTTNLILKDNEVLGTQSMADFIVSYHATQTDANDNTNVLPANFSNTNITETIYARIANRNNSKCYGTTSFTVVVKQAPELLTVEDWTVCDDDTDGLYTFDLSTKDSEILGTQDVPDFTISYHSTQAEADLNTNALATNYTNTSVSEALFFRIENSTYPECYETGSFTIEVILGAIANAATNISVCDDDNDGFFAFDLTIKNSEILGTQNPSSFSITYYASQLDADDDANALPSSSFTNSSTYNQTIYARIANTSNTECYDTTSFDLIVSDSPIVDTVSNWSVCDDDNDGVSNFTLTEKNIEILGEQSAADFTISYHENLTDAQSNTNPIIGPWNNTTRTQQVFYRIESSANIDCYKTDSFDIVVYDTPSASSPTPFIVCYTNETGKQGFNLANKDLEILNGQDASLYTVFYYATEMDAMLMEKPLNKTDYTNTLLNETLYARVQNNILEECYQTTTLQLFVNTLPQISLETSYVICPESPELTIDGGDFESWSWKDDSGTELSDNRTFDSTEVGTYSLTVSETKNSISCANTHIFEVFSSGAPETLEVAIGDFSDKAPITLNATGTGDLEYSIDGTTFQNSNRFEVFPGEYTVYVRDAFLCRTLSQVITVIGFEKFFTPNGDTFHEYWNIIGGDAFPNSTLSIYDRYGTLLQQLAPTQKGWDGTFNGRPLPATDYWFRYEYDNGKVFKGHFTLKR